MARKHDWEYYFGDDNRMISWWSEYFDDPKVANEWADYFEEARDAYDWSHYFDDPAIAAKWAQHFDEPEVAATMSKYFDDPKKAAKHVDKPKYAKLISKDITQSYMKYFKDPDTAMAWEKLHYLVNHPKHAKALSKHFDPDTAEEWLLVFGDVDSLDDVDIIVEWSKYFDDPREAYKWHYKIKDPKKAKDFSQYFDDPKDIGDWHIYFDDPKAVLELMEIYDDHKIADVAVRKMIKTGKYKDEYEVAMAIKELIDRGLDE